MMSPAASTATLVGKLELATAAAAAPPGQEGGDVVRALRCGRVRGDILVAGPHKGHDALTIEATEQRAAAQVELAMGEVKAVMEEAEAGFVLLQ
jgi:hypothetical protein